MTERTAYEHDERKWRLADERGPWAEQPYRQFVRLEGSCTHHGATWSRVYCGEAFVRPPDADDELLGYRFEDIQRLCQHGDIDIKTAKVTHWMPVIFPSLTDDERMSVKP